MKGTVRMVGITVVAVAGAAFPRAAVCQEAPAGADIVIAAETSAFKQAVVSNVTARLASAGRAYRVTDLNGLRDVSVGACRAVVILNEIWAWRLRGEVRRFLKRIAPEQRAKVILVSTAGGEDWRAKEEGVHALTAASTVPNQTRAADFICENIDLLLKPEN